MASTVDHTQPLNSSNSAKQVKPHIQAWSDNVTVPHPFSFSNETHTKKSKAVKELEEKRMREQILEELECQKQFKAHSVPSFVSTPLYEHLIKQNEERKNNAKEKSQERMQALLKPFSFSIMNSKKSKSEEKPENKIFKANPFPSKIFASEIDLKMQDKEIKRIFAKNLRCKNMLTNSEAPKAIVEHEKKLEQKKNKCVKGLMLDFIHEELNKFHPKIHRDIPDYDQLYMQFINKNLKNNVKCATKCEPFHFETNERKKKIKTIEKRMSSASLNDLKYPLEQFSTSRLFPSSIDTIPVLETKTSVLRARQARNHNEQAQSILELGLKQVQMRKLQNKDLHKSVREKSTVNDLKVARTNIEEKVKTQRLNEQERMKQYKKEIKEMQQRISNRPLLLEQIAQMNAKLKAEKKHTDILERNKVEMTFVQEKSEMNGEHNERNEVLELKRSLKEFLSYPQSDGELKSPKITMDDTIATSTKSVSDKGESDRMGPLPNVENTLNNHQHHKETNYSVPTVSYHDSQSGEDNFESDEDLDENQDIKSSIDDDKSTNSKSGYHVDDGDDNDDDDDDRNDDDND